MAPGLPDRSALASIIFVLKTGIAWQIRPGVGQNGILFAVRLLAAIAYDATQLPPLVDAIPAIFGPPPVDQRRPGLERQSLDSQ
jgi:hypothetical protein